MMMASDEGSGIVWAKWSLRDGGRIDVIATYAKSAGYTERELNFESLNDAARVLGESFREVVSRVTAAGYTGGRWRP
jgi:hypothetical protein